MKKIKETKKKANKKVVEEETINFKNVITVFIYILILFVIFYGLTILVVKKLDNKKETKTNYNNIKENSDDIAFVDLLKQEEDLYYVIAIKDNDDVYSLYTKNIKEGFYNIDLNNALNKSFIGNETIIAEDVKDIVISDTTLFVVENHVITEYYVGKDDVVNKLKTIAF